MYLGFLTGCLGNISLKEKARFASENGLKAIEVSCWPKSNDRDYSACDIDAAVLTKEGAAEINAYLSEYGLTISSLAYYDNNLSADHEIRKKINSHLLKVIDAAVLLGVDKVGTFIGRNHKISLEQNFDEFERVFTKIVNYAQERGIKIIIENCPMVGWQTAGMPGTISFSPELWREMFKRVPNSNFGLNYDPSHLRMMLMDYISPIFEFGDRIFHTHAKDMCIDQAALLQTGVYNKQLGSSSAKDYTNAVMPGLGDIDFKAWVEALKAVGYNGVVSIEHEDRQYEGTTEKVKEGLKIAIKNLKELI